MRTLVRCPFEYVYRPWAEDVARETGISATVVAGVIVCFVIGLPFDEIAALSGVALPHILALYRRTWQHALPEASTQERIERRFLVRSEPPSSAGASAPTEPSQLLALYFHLAPAGR